MKTYPINPKLIGDVQPYKTTPKVCATCKYFMDRFGNCLRADKDGNPIITFTMENTDHWLMACYMWKKRDTRREGTVLVNICLSRKAEGKIETKIIRLEVDAEWGGSKMHTLIIRRIEKDHPGWTVAGYAPKKEETNGE